MLGATMTRDRAKTSAASRVTALFDTAALSFPLPAGATFQDLADHFEHVATRTGGKPVAITVRLASQPSR
jgi:hypothetical protein